MNTVQLINILVHFSASIAYVGLIGFVLYKNPKALLNRLCALTVGAFAIWTMADIFFYSASSANEAMLWLNVASPGLVQLPRHRLLVLSGVHET